MARALTIVNGTILGAPGATAVSVEDGRIAAVGGRELARQGAGTGGGSGAEVVDARGGLVMPGFDDAHLHLVSGARAMGRAQLYPLGTPDAILAEIRRHADANPDAPWVLGRGWLYAPFPGGNNAVNRQTRDGLPAGGWLPGERLAVADALEAYTAGSAFAAFAEGRRGRIAPGLDADLVVLDRDLLAAAPSAIIGTGVRLTVLGGRIVHRSEG